MKALWMSLLGCILALPACATPPERANTTTTFSVTSSAYREGEMIPARYTADGENLHPPYHITGLPKGTSSLALIMDDPDAPGGTWVHWVAWNLPPDEPDLPAGQVPEGSAGGTNSWGTLGYGGPSPPSGTHRYFLEVFALDCRLDLPTSTGAEGLRQAIQGHVLATGRLMGRYSH